MSLHILVISAVVYINHSISLLSLVYKVLNHLLIIS